MNELEEMNAELERLSSFILERRHNELCARVDRLLGTLMTVQWVVVVLVSCILTPSTWTGAQSSINPHVVASLFLGGLITFVPVALSSKMPGKAVTRHCIASGQLLMSALIIHICGGRIESHFHVFCSLAFLGLYRDWRIFVLPTLIVAIDHAVRGLFFPQSVYGVSIVQPYRWLEHTGWVLFEDVVLVISSIYSANEMKIHAHNQAQVELSNAVFEQAVVSRTADLQIARDQALEATQLKSQFLANMSHELRTPLSGVIGVADLLSESHLDRRQKELVEILMSSSNALLSVINDLLDLSKIEARKMTLEVIACPVGELLDETANLIRPRAEEKELTVEVSIDPALPKYINSDPVRLRQILLNLAANAVKFTEQGTIRISASSFVESGNSMIKFSVSDTGIGIPKSISSHLFEPFFQAEGSTARTHGGTGLGLSICKRLVDLMGGRIGFESEEAKGSTFWFVLQCVPGAPHGQGKVSIIDEDRQMMRREHEVMVVEDSAMLFHVVSLQLEKLGYRVLHAKNGKEAIDILSEHPVDLILMDCQMPEMDGYQAAEAIRDMEKKGVKKTPIIAMTASAMTSDREKCLASGMDDYVSKPVRKEVLDVVLKKWLSENPVDGEERIGKQ